MAFMLLPLIGRIRLFATFVGTTVGTTRPVHTTWLLGNEQNDGT